MIEDKSKIQEQLGRILKDKAFSRSKINGRLLRFLVNASIEGAEIKEVIIGTELFGKAYDPLKDDNKVRVYIYHLRKKLAEYYEQDNRKGELIFTIEKGQYHVSFSEWSEMAHSKENTSRKVYWIGALSLTLVVALSLWLFQDKSNRFWKQLLSNDLQVVVLFGDFFTINGPIVTNGSGVTRDYAINSTDDLDRYLNKNPNLATAMHPSKHPYLGGHAPYCCKAISYFLFQNKKDFKISLVSEWAEGDLQTDNIVYFGPAKTMGVMQKIVTDAFPQYEFGSEMLKRKDPITGEITIYKDVVSFEDKISDYTIVGKVSMRAGNQMTFFLSDQDCGAISAIEYFTNRDSVQSFYARNHIDTQDFIALFKVSGWERKSYEMEFIKLDVREAKKESTEQ